MIQTEKRYWRNGYQVRGGWFKTLALSLFCYGVIINNTKNTGVYEINFYKLTNY
jgi:hypothetical protein